MTHPGLALVTGASGFVGGHLARRLLNDGYKVRLLLRRPDSIDPSLAQQCEIVQGDLNQHSAMQAAVKDCHYVFHCAANANTWDTKQNYEAANVQGLLSLLMALSNANYSLQRLVHLSTVDVYGYPDTPCDEECEPRKVGFAYGDSKLDGEILLRNFADDHNLPYVILRPANIIGPGSQFIDQISQALNNNGMLTIDHGRANAGLVYIDNLMDYMLWAATADAALNETYNVRDHYDVSWREFIHRLQSLTDNRSRVKNLSFRVAALAARGFEKTYRLCRIQREPPLHSLLVSMFGKTCGHSAEKIRSASGFSSRVGFEEAMSLSAQWLQQTNIENT